MTARDGSEAMRIRTMLLGLALAGAGAAGWFWWTAGEVVEPGGPVPEARQHAVEPAAGAEVIARSAAEAPGAEAAETKELPPPVVVEEAQASPPRELARDEPRETKWGSLTLRPAGDGNRPAQQ